jgi:hypothetical protein
MSTLIQPKTVFGPYSTTIDTTVGVQDTDPLGTFILEEGYSYQLQYNIYVMDPGGSQNFYHIMFNCLRDGGGVQSIAAEEIAKEDFGINPITIVNGGNGTTSVWMTGTGLGGLTLRWLCELFVINKRAI